MGSTLEGYQEVARLLDIAQFLESTKIKRAAALKGRLDEAVEKSKKLFEENRADSYDRSFALSNLENINDPFENILSEITSSNKDIHDTVSVLMMTPSILRVFELIDSRINKIFKTMSEEKVSDKLMEVIDLLDRYIVFLSKVTDKNRGLLDSALLKKMQSESVLQSYRDSLSQIWWDVNRGVVTPSTVIGNKGFTPQMVALGSGLMELKNVPLLSMQDLHNAMKESVRASVGMITLKKGKGIALRHLPIQIQNICEVIKRVDVGFAEAMKGAAHPALLRIDQSLDDKTGEMRVSVVFGCTIGSYGANFSVEAKMKRGKVNSIDLDGKFFGFLKGAKPEINVNDFMLYAVEACNVNESYPMVQPEGFEIPLTPGCVHFRWEISSEQFPERQLEGIEYHLQKMVDFIAKGTPIPECKTPVALYYAPHLVSAWLGSSVKSIGKVERNCYIEGLSKHLTRENVEIFLQNFQEIVARDDVGSIYLNEILDDLLVLDYVWDEPHLFKQFIRFVDYMSFANSSELSQEMRRKSQLIFNHRYGNRRELMTPHFYDFVHAAAKSNDREFIVHCKNVFSLYLHGIGAASSIIENFDKRIRELERR